MPPYIEDLMNLEEDDFDEGYEDVDDDEDAVEYDDQDVLEQDELQELLVDAMAGQAEDDDEEDQLNESGQDRVQTLLNSLLSGRIETGNNTANNGGNGPVRLSITDLMTLFGAGRGSGDGGSGVRAAGLGSRAQRARDAEDYEAQRSGLRTSNYFDVVTEPVTAGVDLLHSGEFGRMTSKTKPSNRSAHVSKYLRQRATRGRPTFADREDVASHIVPNTNGVTVARYGSNAYVGQFSSDSSFYYTCVQDFRLHIYDQTIAPTPWNPSRRSATSQAHHETTMSVRRTIQGASGWWTITDSHLSPDNERIVYSTMGPTLYMASTRQGSEGQTPLDFSGRQRRPWGGESFGIMGCRFSADGSEVFAASNSGNIFVYDLNADKRTVAIDAHDEDVNSCCWADSQSGNVLVSASDDSFLKVWDRRSLGESGKPAGVLVGHTEGITFVTAKGDGRYVASNGKDQAMRLWDLRQMRTNKQFEQEDTRAFYGTGYDYRQGFYPRPKHAKHPNDCSVMTYRGHSVLKTLIRCHFSPAETTGSQYLYSASSDGRIHIYSLDGVIVQVLDRGKVLPMSYDPSEPEPENVASSGRVCVRDVSWHSQQPVLMSVGWEGGRYGGSIVARHEWKGLSKMGNRLEDWVQKHEAEAAERSRIPTAQTIPGQFLDDDLW